MDKLNKKLPLYNIVLNNDDDGGMYRISLVTNPAIEENFIYFAEEKEEVFKVVDQEKGIIVGPVIVPDKPIYRRNDSRGEFYVQFPKDTIEMMMRKYAKNGLHNSFNLQHSYPTEEVYMLEMWMKEGDQDKSNLYGFDLPVGTVFAMAQVDSDIIREEIKANGLNGFSIEIKGFDIVEQSFSNQTMDFKFAVELGERLAKSEAAIAELKAQNEILMELWSESQEGYQKHVMEQEENLEVETPVVEEQVEEKLEEQIEEKLEEQVQETVEETFEETPAQVEEPVTEESFEEETPVEEAEMALSAEQEAVEEPAVAEDKSRTFERITPDKVNMIDKFFGKRYY